MTAPPGLVCEPCSRRSRGRRPPPAPPRRRDSPSWADITPLEVITFTPWTDPVLDQCAIDPSGHYSRIAWLPILGPTSWLLLGTISQHLADQPAVTWRLADLARDHGLGRPDRPGFVVLRSLRRLEHFGLLRFEATDQALIRTNMPLLGASQLRRSAPHVRDLHHLTFPPHHARGA